MRIQTILNRVEKFKSFVYGGSLEEQEVSPRWCGVGNSETAARCAPDVGGLVPPMTAWRNGDSSSCHCGGIAVFFTYRMRRVNCAPCGVRVEIVPWCDGKNT